MRGGTLPRELRNESKEADLGKDCPEPPLVVDHVGLLANMSDGGAIGEGCNEAIRERAATMTSSSTSSFETHVVSFESRHASPHLISFAPDSRLVELRSSSLVNPPPWTEHHHRLQWIGVSF